MGPAGGPHGRFFHALSDEDREPYERGSPRAGWGAFHLHAQGTLDFLIFRVRGLRWPRVVFLRARRPFHPRSSAAWSAFALMVTRWVSSSPLSGGFAVRATHLLIASLVYLCSRCAAYMRPAGRAIRGRGCSSWHSRHLSCGWRPVLYAKGACDLALDRRADSSTRCTRSNDTRGHPERSEDLHLPYGLFTSSPALTLPRVAIPRSAARHAAQN